MQIITILKSVAAAATPEAITATALKVSSIVIQPYNGDATSTGANTGKVVVGKSDVDWTLGVQLGIPTAGATPPSYTIQATKMSNELDLAEWWIKVAVNGEKVVITALQT